MADDSLDRATRDDSDADVSLKGYQWPASRLTKGDMMKLSELRSQTGEPITQLLHDAVDAYYRMLNQDNGQSGRPAD